MLRSCRSTAPRAYAALCTALFTLSSLDQQGAVAHADPLTELLQKAQGAVQQLTEPDAGPSALTMIWLSSASLDRAKSQALIDRSIKAATQESARYLKTMGVSSLKPAHLVKRLNVTHVPVDERFPLNLSALVQVTRVPARQAMIQRATSAMMISYRGDALRGHEQLKLTCVAALSALRPLEGEGVLILLEPQVALSLSELRARCEETQAEGLTQRWARPDLERLESGALRLVSRGRAQLGQPELELGPLTAAQARALWPAFISHLTGDPKAGEGQLMVSAERCARAPHLVEGRCVRLALRTSNPAAPAGDGRD